MWLSLNEAVESVLKLKKFQFTNFSFDDEVRKFLE